MKGVVRLDEGGSLVDLAVRRVREHIRTADLKVGDTLPGEGQFATDIGVSRAVMREAFGALAALRLIDVANGRRARVGAIDGSVIGTSLDHAVATDQVSVSEVWDVRRTLELRTAELAALNRTDADAAEITAAADAMRAARDIDEITRNDIIFHQAIARASGNVLFLQIIRSFAPLMTVAVPVAWQTRKTPQARDEVLRRHIQIAQAISDRDGGSASTLMIDHFDVSIGSVL
ncbi:FadR/GntR family transcriptional regulator [uncultured Sphingomonas sp.]|uniref:FadR/GntR family transcriptional regulator n=1 Tax=uncultured Sphingomonas sp. TaxID=158754 RepID=UPI0026148F32|nr:FCD domain-containing protein [uncultured Sphingomonas sp.]